VEAAADANAAAGARRARRVDRGGHQHHVPAEQIDAPARGPRGGEGAAAEQPAAGAVDDDPAAGAARPIRRGDGGGRVDVRLREIDPHEAARPGRPGCADGSGVQVIAGRDAHDAPRHAVGPDLADVHEVIRRRRNRTAGPGGQTAAGIDVERAGAGQRQRPGAGGAVDGQGSGRDRQPARHADVPRHGDAAVGVDEQVPRRGQVAKGEGVGRAAAGQVDPAERCRAGAGEGRVARLGPAVHGHGQGAVARDRDPGNDAADG
jgi:hypothetical protein